MTFLTRPRPHHGGSHTRTNSRGKTIEEIREQIEHWGLPDDVLHRIFTETPYSGKFNVGRYTRYMEDLMRVKNALGICTIYTYQALIFADDMARLYSAAVGEDVSAWDLVNRGERISNIAKLLNVREGFSRVDDQPPAVWFTPMNSPDERIVIQDYYQTTELTPDDLSRMLDDYYDERGWDRATGSPSGARLEQLGLGAYAESRG
jgi:aldehyde:ferredoxin oxidoreductase